MTEQTKHQLSAYQRWQNPVYRALATEAIANGRRKALKETLWYELPSDYPESDLYLLTLKHEGEELVQLKSTVKPRQRVSNYVSHARFRLKKGSYVSTEARRILELIDSGKRLFVEVQAL